MGLLPSSAFTLAVVAMFFLGVINPIVNGPLMAAVQAAVAPEMQGRVFSLIGSVSAAMSPTRPDHRRAGGRPSGRANLVHDRRCHVRADGHGRLSLSLP